MTTAILDQSETFPCFKSYDYSFFEVITVGMFFCCHELLLILKRVQLCSVLEILFPDRSNVVVPGTPNQSRFIVNRVIITELRFVVILFACI